MADINFRSLEATPSDIRLWPIYTPPVYPATDILLSGLEVSPTDVRLLSQGQGYSSGFGGILYHRVGGGWVKALLAVKNGAYEAAALKIRKTGTWRSVDTTGV